MHEDVRQAVLTALESLAAAHEVDIVDVEVAGAAAAPIVRVRIDHADESLPTITLDEVTAETDWISAALDELDPLPGAYTLEVSSPGMDRPLRRVHDFERFAGQQVSLTTTATEGRRRYSGTLGGVADGDVVIADDEGRRYWGVGVDNDITMASVHALITAINRENKVKQFIPTV